MAMDMGIAASTTFGIAKNAYIISVKVLPRDEADIVKGIDVILNRHKQRRKNSNFEGSVVDLSLGIE
ncbi:Similar to Subtilisin-like protease 3; acc. no. P25036 [Pyronema omphalodes CBS 100304]|uniref:Similar to Subtilisin-like protease 3 acc. no. P25036 n=1 Tax=Pyronema omphalodes (strain CBS 100304) TaxID=1076935 RepID=U4L2J3_PYROM|nr:Similar to Subtilisin-like protease 3; acc. no. P25036 [Pyronema omphalodes CBS 100304]